jgi:aryl-alcohol dehydrogenase-like predicted oxidoreductase
MEYRHLGRSGLKVSEIGLGSWLTYGNQVDRERTQAIVRRALDLGVIFFDTADIYHAGAGETELGLALEGVRRSDYVLATKCFWPMSANANDRGLSRKHIVESCEKSLKRLRTDYVDLFQCHRFDEETPLDETLRALEDLTRSGKALHAGISEWTPDQIDAAVARQDERGFDRIISSQPQYSMLWRVIEREVIPTCERLGIGQVVWSPLAQGVLTGKYRPGEAPPEGSRATDERVNGFIQGFLREPVLEAVDRLRPVAAEAGLSLTVMALAWVLRQPNVSAAIVGATSPEQLEESCRASGVRLDQATLDAIDTALEPVIRR